MPTKTGPLNHEKVHTYERVCLPASGEETLRKSHPVCKHTEMTRCNGTRVQSPEITNFIISVVWWFFSGRIYGCVLQLLYPPIHGVAPRVEVFWLYLHTIG